MVLVIDLAGTIRTIHTELLDLAALGAQNIVRASHVEPDAAGNWYVEIIEGPRLGPFSRRSEALAAEVAWLTEHRLERRSSPVL